MARLRPVLPWLGGLLLLAGVVLFLLPLAPAAREASGGAPTPLPEGGLKGRLQAPAARPTIPLRPEGRQAVPEPFRVITPLPPLTLPLSSSTPLPAAGGGGPGRGIALLLILAGAGLLALGLAARRAAS